MDVHVQNGIVNDEVHMNNLFSDLVTIEQEPTVRGDIIIKINGHKLLMLQTAVHEFPELPYNTYDAIGLLSYIIEIIRLAKRQNIINAEDLLYKKISDILNSDSISQDAIKDLLTDINKVHELVHLD